MLGLNPGSQIQISGMVQGDQGTSNPGVSQGNFKPGEGEQWVGLRLTDPSNGAVRLLLVWNVRFPVRIFI